MYNIVMVIDDTYIDRYIAERNIMKHGFANEVILKDSAISALDYLASNVNAQQNLPQLIFLDINTPEVNGFEFLEAFQKLPQEVHNICDIIMLSSSLDAKDHKKVSENKFVSSFLNKPLNKVKLKEILNTKVNSL